MDIQNHLESGLKESFRPTNNGTIRTVGIVGAGEVVRDRIGRALAHDCFSYLKVAICSRENVSPISSLRHQYYQSLSNNSLPLDELDRAGFVGDQALWVIATPSDSHVPYTLHLAPLCSRIAIEKPIASDGPQARVLRPLMRHGCQILPMDHKLFARESLDFLDRCRRDPSLLSEVRFIEGVYFEPVGFAEGRAQENVIKDIQWHLFMLMIAALKTASTDFEIMVGSASVARHLQSQSKEFADAGVPTASRVRGTVKAHEIDFSFDFLQAKAVSSDTKYLRFRGARREILAHVDLSESGWRPHARMLHTLIGPFPDMRHDPADAITLAGLLTNVVAQAREEDSYSCGEVPGFLSKGLRAPWRSCSLASYGWPQATPC